MDNGQGSAIGTRRMRQEIVVEERILLRFWQLERPAEVRPKSSLYGTRICSETILTTVGLCSC